MSSVACSWVEHGTKLHLGKETSSSHLDVRSCPLLTYRCGRMHDGDTLRIYTMVLRAQVDEFVVQVYIAVRQLLSIVPNGQHEGKQWTGHPMPRSTFVSLLSSMSMSMATARTLAAVSIPRLATPNTRLLSQAACLEMREDA